MFLPQKEAVTVTVTTTWVLGRIWRVRIDQALGMVLDTESPICVHCGGSGYGCRSHLIWFLTDTQCQSRPNFGYEVPTVPPKILPEKVNFQPTAWLSQKGDELVSLFMFETQAKEKQCPASASGHTGQDNDSYKRDDCQTKNFL